MIALLLLAACSSSGIPDDAREPNAAEWVALDETRLRWEERIGGLDDHCAMVAGRSLVVTADERRCLDLCWRNPPSQYVPVPETESRWGRKASCILYRSECAGVGSPWWDCEHSPIHVVFAGLPHDVHLTALQHEHTHALAHCTGTAHLTHREPALWGPNGVTPL